VNIEKLIEHFGSQSELARYLGVTRASVCQWVADGYMTNARAYEIEVKSGGKFKARDLMEQTQLGFGEQ